jgi:nucleoside-diphosphate-sugar epimerase
MKRSGKDLKGITGQMAIHLVTGASGCIGAWVIRTLLEQGDDVLAVDIATERHRVDAVVPEEMRGSVTWVQGDVTETEAFSSLVASSNASSIIHLAGLQVPSCRTNPVLGATVNVIGTLNVFEAARAASIDRVVYASSAAVHGPPTGAPGHACRENESLDCRTHYGVFKQANEGTARIMYHDYGLSSIGLRPFTVYGVGRDFGLTSGPTTAIKSALLDQPFSIGFRGPTDFQFVSDVAKIFVRCIDEGPEGAHVYNIHGTATTVENVVEIIDSVLPLEKRGLISCDGPTLPMPEAMCGKALDAAIGNVPNTPLSEGFKETYDALASLHAKDALDTRDLPSEATGS